MDMESLERYPKLKGWKNIKNRIHEQWIWNWNILILSVEDLNCLHGLLSIPRMMVVVLTYEGQKQGQSKAVIT